jgi:hypothetical protein
VLLVVDGMTGQEAVRIGQAFTERIGVDGLVLTKMDGDARGGAALSLRQVTASRSCFSASARSSTRSSRSIPRGSPAASSAWATSSASSSARARRCRSKTPSASRSSSGKGTSRSRTSSTSCAS